MGNRCREYDCGRDRDCDCGHDRGHDRDRDRDRGHDWDEYLWVFDPRTSLLCRQGDFIGAYGIFNKHVKYGIGYMRYMLIY